MARRARTGCIILLLVELLAALLVQCEFFKSTLNLQLVHLFASYFWSPTSKCNQLNFRVIIVSYFTVWHQSKGLK